MDKFWDQVEKTSGCWIWKGKSSPNGYGYFGAFIKAHRLSYQLSYGDIPRGGIIKHKCDNKLCVNPQHLELGTYSENLKEAYARGLRKPRKPNRKSIRLSDQQVFDIQNSSQCLGHLSKLYGISTQRIRSIKKGVIRLKELDTQAIRNDSGTIKELAIKYKISKQLVALVREGCYEKVIPITQGTKEKVIELSKTIRFNQHPNYSKIGKVLGISRQTVKKILVDHGIIGQNQA